MDANARLLDHRVRPDRREQLVLADHFAGATHECDQQADGARSEPHRLPVALEPWLGFPQYEGAEAPPATLETRTSPRCVAFTATCALEPTCSFSQILETCALTVVAEMSSLRAIPLLQSPFTRKRSTSSSRAVKPARGAPCLKASSCACRDRGASSRHVANGVHQLGRVRILVRIAVRPAGDRLHDLSLPVPPRRR